MREFVFDWNLSKRLVTILRLVDGSHKDRVARHLKRYYKDQNTPDEVWIPGLATHNPRPVVVCGDGRILKSKSQCQTLANSGLTFFFLRPQWMNASFEEQCWKFVQRWPLIVKKAQTNTPTVFSVPYRNLVLEELSPTHAAVQKLKPTKK